MNSILKVTATMYLILLLGVDRYPIGACLYNEFNYGSFKAETPIFVTARCNAFLLLLKPDKPKEIKLGKPGISISHFPLSRTDKKAGSYFFINDIHNNLPLVQYKFPLSEHTEAG